MKKYHVIIVNNETGERQVDVNTDIMVGALDEGEHIRGLSAVYGNAPTVASVLQGATKVIDELMNEHPELRILMQLQELSNRKTANEEGRTE